MAAILSQVCVTFWSWIMDVYPFALRAHPGDVPLSVFRAHDSSFGERDFAIILDSAYPPHVRLDKIFFHLCISGLFGKLPFIAWARVCPFPFSTPRDFQGRSIHYPSFRVDPHL